MKTRVKTCVFLSAREENTRWAGTAAFSFGFRGTALHRSGALAVPMGGPCGLLICFIGTPQLQYCCQCPPHTRNTQHPILAKARRSANRVEKNQPVFFPIFNTFPLSYPRESDQTMSPTFLKNPDASNMAVSFS